MKIDDIACLAKGVVSPSLVDISTGRMIPFVRRHNTLSYMSAEAMAAAFGGDPSYIPARVGFIYGNKSSMPSEAPISRNQSWDMLKTELYSTGVGDISDVQVVGFSYSPSLGPETGAKGDGQASSSSDSSSSGQSGPSDEAGDYSHILAGGSNAITFHAVSNSQDRGAAFGSEAFKQDNYIYQAVLLGVHAGEYHILSRVSLKDGDAYLQKPAGFEIALDWTIVFH